MKNPRENIILVSFFYLSTIAGTCPFLYDSSKNLLRFSKVRSTFGILLYGTAALLTSPLGSIAAINRNLADDVTTKDFAIIIEILNEYAKNVVSLVSLILFIWNRNAFLDLFNEILSTDCESASHSSTHWNPEKQFSIIVAFKVGLGLLIWTLYLGWFLLNFIQINWIALLIYCGYTSLFMLQLFTVHYFFIAVAVISKTWQENNINLLGIVEEYKYLVSSRKAYGLARDKCAALSDRMDEISILYRKLFELQSQLRTLFETQITGLVATSFFSNVSASFSTYTFFYGDRFNWSTMIVFGLLTAASLLDSFLIPWICERSIKSYKTTKDILGEFSKLKELDINRTFMLVDNLKVSYLLCGLFDLSHSSAFMVLSSSMTFLVILVQFDYEYGDFRFND